MKRSYQLRSSWPTRIGVLLSVALLSVFTSCVDVGGDRMQLSSSDFRPELAQGQITIYLKDGSERQGLAGEQAQWLLENAALVDSIDLKCAEAKDMPDYKPEPKTCVLEPEQFNIIARDDFSPITIYRRDGYTEVDVMYEVLGTWYWVFYTSNACLVDRKSGERYMVKGIAGGKPLNEFLVVRDCADKFAMHTLIFPPIKEGVERLDYDEGDLPDSIARPANSLEKDIFIDVEVKGDIERPYRDARNGAKVKVDISELKL